jgi:hypothetical protein
MANKGGQGGKGVGREVKKGAAFDLDSIFHRKGHNICCCQEMSKNALRSFSMGAQEASVCRSVGANLFFSFPPLSFEGQHVRVRCVWVDGDLRSGLLCSAFCTQPLIVNANFVLLGLAV